MTLVNIYVFLVCMYNTIYSYHIVKIFFHIFNHQKYIFSMLLKLKLKEKLKKFYEKKVTVSGKESC